VQLIVATNNTAIVTTSDDGFTDLIGKRALRRRHQSSEKGRPGMVEEEVGKGKAMGTGSGHGTPSGTKDLKEEIGETVREGDTPSPANRGPATRGRRCQKRATWAEVVVAGGANIPTVFNLKKKFNLLGLPFGDNGKGVYRCSRNRGWSGTPKNAGTSKESEPSKEAPSGRMES
jgi:hypothetical protein